jgi:hypothetical protein
MGERVPYLGAVGEYAVCVDRRFGAGMRVLILGYDPGGGRVLVRFADGWEVLVDAGSLAEARAVPGAGVQGRLW